MLHPEDRSTPGEDLLGEKGHAEKGKNTQWTGSEFSEDGLQLISSVSGHVTLENDKVFVSNVLEIVDIEIILPVILITREC